MITILGIFFLALAAIGFASDALLGPEDPDRAAEGKPDGLAVLLFALCLASVLAHCPKAKADDEE